MLPKIRIPSKKAWNKSCSELNFIQKSSRRICLSVPPPLQSGARGQERLICLKYYMILKWQITFRHILACVNAYTFVCKVPSNILQGEGGVLHQMFMH